MPPMPAPPMPMKWMRLIRPMGLSMRPDWGLRRVMHAHPLRQRQTGVGDLLRGIRAGFGPRPLRHRSNSCRAVEASSGVRQSRRAQFGFRQQRAAPASTRKRAFAVW